ncbi:hypothetical protein GCM10018962_01030 [Dactylosporangium matsuzakiense]|uniref:Uncharacterized protein n=1 Tax=Dactylosporangium matsuzakiense TaxID=53360 RepID=A0A9W6NKD6_9ACTN|nr:hypothetical protein GCM10017581_017510 [Dactylosporangium matsuzakiense]
MQRTSSSRVTARIDIPFFVLPLSAMEQGIAVVAAIAAAGLVMVAVAVLQMLIRGRRGRR